MRIAFLAATMSAAALIAGCATTYDDGRYGAYDWNRPDPSYGGYHADRYYRDDRRYRERQLSRNDRIYRGQDGRYYCRRSDGTTGLIVGGLAGGVLGNVIAPGGSETLGTIIGAAAGAAIGREVERGNARCR
ncbi:MAG: glycine zipper 2TM domain-containing protein [Sphingomonas sp.]|nr:glycine zipper 2TM domain-containing protein [Sphingomonas sp.]